MLNLPPVLRNAWVQGALGLALFVGGLREAVLLLQGIDTSISVLVLVMSLFSLLATPWAGLLLIGVVALMLWRGIRQTTRAAERGKDVDQIAWAAETAARKEMLDAFREEFEVLALIPRFVRLSREVQLLRSLRAVGPAIENAKGVLAGLQREEVGSVERKLGEAFDRITFATGNSIELGLPEPPYPPGVGGISRETCDRVERGPGFDIYMFEPERNTRLIRGLEEHIVIMEGWNRQVEALLEKKEEELRSMLGYFT